MKAPLRILRLDRNWLVVAALSVFAWAPLLYPGFFQSNSGLAAVYRVTQPDTAAAYFTTAAGDAAPLAYALGRFLDLLGLDAVAAVRAVYGLALLGAGLAMYLCARRLLGAAAGLVSALAYVYLPYTLGLVYVRGALSEAAFLALLPLAAWAVAGMARPRRDRWILFWPIAVAVSGPLLALAHPGLALAALPALLAIAWREGGKARAMDVAMILAAGAALAIYSLVPPSANMELPGPPAAAAPWGVDPYRFLAPVWQAGPGEPPFQLGVAAVVLAILAVSELFWGRESGGNAAGSDREDSAVDPLAAAGARGTGPARRAAPADPTAAIGRTPAPMAMAAGKGRSRKHRADRGRGEARLAPAPSPAGRGEAGLATAATGLSAAGAGGQGGDAIRGLCLALTLALLAVMTPPGAALWARLGLQALLPQPWQLLAVAALPLSLLAGSALAGPRWGPMLRQPLTLAAVLAAILLASYPYLSPRTIPAAILPDPGKPPVGRFEDGMLLAGLRAEQPAGQRVLRVTLTWQALAPVSQDYTVFTHLLDSSGKQVGQKDAPPLNGARPTNTWLPGEMVSDTLEIALGPEVGPGRYTVDAGLYVLATGQRAALAAPARGSTQVAVPVEIR